MINNIFFSNRVDTNTSNNSNQIPKVEGNKSSNVIHDNNENIQKSDTSLIEHTKNDNMTNGIKSPIKVNILPGSIIFIREILPNHFQFI